MMKKIFLFSMVLLAPALAWSDPKPGPNKLVVVLGYMDGLFPAGHPCETVTPGVGKQQIDANHMLTGTPVIIGILATDPSFNALGGAGIANRMVRLSVKDKGVLAFLSGGLRETTEYHDLPLQSVPPPFPPGYFGAIDTVYPWRATSYQWGATPFDLTEYVFTVEDLAKDVLGALLPDTLLPDESTPLDSVMPNVGTFTKLLLVLSFTDYDPAEQHYPGTYTRGKRGFPERGISAGFFYDYWIYGVDQWFNAVPFDPAESVWLQDCESIIWPHTVEPPEAGSSPGTPLHTDVTRPTDGGIDQVAKVHLSVLYATPGYAGLKAVSVTSKESSCEHFPIFQEGPAPGDEIRVNPNPGGSPGLPIKISIISVDLGGGKIYGKIYDVFGYIIRDFSEELQAKYYADPEAPFLHLEWDARNEKGHEVANGCYHMCVEVVQVEKAGVWKQKIGVVW